MTGKPQRSPVASALDALDFIVESQQLQTEVRSFVMQLLPLLDSIHKLCPDMETLTPEQLAERAAALALLPEVADAACDSIGLVRFGAAGGPIDPERCEVVATQQDANHSTGTIVDVLEPGWEMDGAVLRQARVVAVKNS